MDYLFDILMQVFGIRTVKWHMHSINISIKRIKPIKNKTLTLRSMVPTPAMPQIDSLTKNRPVYIQMRMILQESKEERMNRLRPCEYVFTQS